MTQPLNYESPAPGNERLRVERGEDGSVTITVPTRRSVKRFLAARLEEDIGAALLIPVVWPLAWLVFKLFATQKPRAVIRLTPTEFALRETSDSGFGIIETTCHWRMSEIGELRPNRYESGLYFTIRGKESGNLFTDLPQDLVAQIGQILSDTRSSYTAST